MTIARMSKFPGFLMVHPSPPEQPAAGSRRPQMPVARKRAAGRCPRLPQSSATLTRSMAAILVLAAIPEHGSQRVRAPSIVLLRSLLGELGGLFAPALLAEPCGVVPVHLLHRVPGRIGCIGV